jgi:hypothetical protein
LYGVIYKYITKITKMSLSKAAQNGLRPKFDRLKF